MGFCVVFEEVKCSIDEKIKIVKFQQILALGKYLLGFCLNFNQQILYS
jgi:hypothetical protein